MEQSYFQRLFNNQGHEFDYDYFPDENPMTPLLYTCNPILSKKQKKEEDKNSEIMSELSEYTGFATKDKLPSVLLEKHVEEEQPIYDSQYLLTDDDIDKIVAYYRSKKKKKLPYDLFTSKMFLQRFQEPYKDHNIYEKYILKALKDIQSEQEEMRSNTTLVSKPNAENSYEENSSVYYRTFEPPLQQSSTLESSSELEGWSFHIFFGHWQQNPQGGWSIHMKKIPKHKSVWKTIQDWFS